MANSLLADHLDRLISGLSDATGSERSYIDEWARLQRENGPSKTEDTLNIEDSSWQSVLDLYNSQIGVSNPLISKLRLKPNFNTILPSIHSLLSSNRSDDEVSAELVEILGFDDIELVMQVVSSRPSLVHEMEQLLTVHTFHDAPPMDSFDPLHVQLRMEQKLRENAARPLFSGTVIPEPERLPHVYTSSNMSQGNILSHTGSKYLLPIGTDRKLYEEYEEVIVPPAKPVPPRETERLIPVSGLDRLAKGCFPGYSTLNRIQSIVYPTAYGSNENMLVCAPTGAGKTDVAMLTILRVLDQHRVSPSSFTDVGDSIDRDAFKIIYVAPMKALASEIVQKFEKRLKWLSIKVRELTGDMQMTKAEIAQTQIIVTTPEKWDVVTRKPTGEGEIASSLKLLIIDEVHLLNEERGAVIETIVARTLRQVETTQSVIRIVGLSATLPNYIDVADFLSVSKAKGLFYFDSSFRPVPLEQHFLGIKGKPGTAQARKNLDTVTFEKISNLVEQGHQVMVFVHARKETVKAAMALKESALAEDIDSKFSCEDHPQWQSFRRRIGESRNKEMKQLFDYGFGIHHAGMLRSDRNLMEDMFRSRAIKVLCCTATLAWGVNLPAHAVIIKGTQVYDSSKGAFVDLSVLDVLQVFGRAGRPGLESSGEGYICTSDDKLTHYLEAVTSQNPIESQFKAGMIDALNAEIALGTVSNISDAVQWLGYTYLFVRMKKNPIVYGISRDEIQDDPGLGTRRNELATRAAQILADAQMIIFNRQNGTFTVTDLGRIAAKYYIRHQSIQTFNKEFRPKMSEADVLRVLSMSTEFDQIQTRESEIKELMSLKENIPCEANGIITSHEVRETISGPDMGTTTFIEKIEITSQGKVNILLQGYISRLLIEDFALVSDSAYVAQNAGRIIRALLEIAISRKWANASAVLMGMSKAVEKRLWPFDHPLKQFELKPDVFYGLETWADDWEPSQLAACTAEELGDLVHLNVHHGQALLNAAKHLPALKIQYDLRPLGSDTLKIQICVFRDFNWSSKLHGGAEPFWLWVEDDEGVNILQHAHVLFKQTTESLNIDFVVPIFRSQTPPFLTIKYLSDRWMGAWNEVIISLDDLVMPEVPHSHTPLMNLPLLPVSASRSRTVESIVLDRLHNFNAIQTQAVWSLIDTRSHSLICAPPGSGKSVLAQILVWIQSQKTSNSWSIIVTPHQHASREVFPELKFAAGIANVTINLGIPHNLLQQPRTRTVMVVTASELLEAMISRDPKSPLKGLDLVICEDLEQMDASYELGVSLLRHATQFYATRFVGLSKSLNDPADLASWLDVDPFAFHSFRPSDRNNPLFILTQTFTIPHSASLFKAMAKPAHSAIRGEAREGAILFVPSRAQCRHTALDLLTQCALETQSDRGYLGSDMSEEYVEHHLSRLKDRSLVDFVRKGVGFFHDGIPKGDRSSILQLYVERVICVLLVPRDACWSLPVRSGTVVVMGTQYVQYTGQEHRLKEYGMPELVRMQSRAVRHSGTGHFHLFCQAEAKDTYMQFLNNGLPLESDLPGSIELETWYKRLRERGELSEKQDIVDVLSFTFLAKRVTSNPTYYDCSPNSLAQSLSAITDKLVRQSG
ncbi:activating signal cointegrator 1 complex subunit 3 [Moniliophthora roreri MCA 2997]|uniref:Activating signal cointegrator 1 complex subunit 3 n=1 Tax=Moniliophthora roreri (strain MCA 2997) TaxID=1381753 RepID=V2XYE0_MONRO|nr:activating signal cointegrator 1 complex subunit 3 [Moniliophthora roreri MCA 2997]